MSTIKDIDFQLYDEKCVGAYNSILKQAKPDMHLKPLELSAFDSKRLCIVNYLRECLQKPKGRRVGDELFISFLKPISRDTLSRWLKTVLDVAGIDFTEFSVHNRRTASTSAAFGRDVPLDTFLTTAGLSRQKTLSKFCCKPVAIKSQKNLARSVLDKFVN